MNTFKIGRVSEVDYSDHLLVAARKALLDSFGGGDHGKQLLVNNAGLSP